MGVENCEMQKFLWSITSKMFLYVGLLLILYDNLTGKTLMALTQSCEAHLKWYDHCVSFAMIDWYFVKCPFIIFLDDGVDGTQTLTFNISDVIGSNISLAHLVFNNVERLDGGLGIHTRDNKCK